MPTVSIVIPAYNHARYLAQAIQSVLAQTYRDIELIVLDDGSTDATREVLCRYGQKFYWETQANIGQSATLNKGWAMARGDVIGYLSADDYLHPECVQRALDVLDVDASVVLTYCDFELVDGRSTPIGVIRKPTYRYADMILDGTCVPGPGAFFRRSVYQQLRGWDTSYRQVNDFEYWLRLGLAGPFRRIPEILAAYRVHDGSQSFAPVTAERADEIIRAVAGVLGAPTLPAEIRRQSARARASSLLLSARLHFYSGRPVLGLARAASAFALHPASFLRPRSYRWLLGGMLGRTGQRLAWRLRRPT